MRVSIAGSEGHKLLNEQGPVKHWVLTDMPLPEGANMILYKDCGVASAYAKASMKKFGIDWIDHPCFKSELFNRYRMQITVLNGNPDIAAYKLKFFYSQNLWVKI